MNTLSSLLVNIFFLTNQENIKKDNMEYYCQQIISNGFFLTKSEKKIELN